MRCFNRFAGCCTVPQGQIQNILAIIPARSRSLLILDTCLFSAHRYYRTAFAVLVTELISGMPVHRGGREELPTSLCHRGKMLLINKLYIYIYTKIIF